MVINNSELFDILASEVTDTKVSGKVLAVSVLTVTISMLLILPSVFADDDTVIGIAEVHGINVTHIDAPEDIVLTPGVAIEQSGYSAIVSHFSGSDNISLSDSYLEIQYDGEGSPTVYIHRVYWDDETFVDYDETYGDETEAKVEASVEILYFQEPGNYDVYWYTEDVDGYSNNDTGVEATSINTLVASEIEEEVVNFDPGVPGEVVESSNLTIKNYGNIILNSSWEGSNYTSEETDDEIPIEQTEIYAEEESMTVTETSQVFTEIPKAEIFDEVGYKPGFTLELPNDIKADTYTNQFNHTIESAL